MIPGKSENASPTGQKVTTASLPRNGWAKDADRIASKEERESGSSTTFHRLTEQTAPRILRNAAPEGRLDGPV